MKLTRYTFRTPLFGSIQAEELLSDTDGRIELSPEHMCRLYDQNEELLMFLTENSADLASYVPEELKYVVLRAEFGDCAMIGGKMYLRTYIWTQEDVDAAVIQRLMDWIAGQMSDGWGEGLEQREWWSRSVEKPLVYFDEYHLDFEEDSETHTVYYFVHPWNSDHFHVYLEDVEDLEEDLDLTVVATMAIPNHNRQVIKLPNQLALKMFLEESGQGAFLEYLEERCPVHNCAIYIAREFDEGNGIKLLPKWALENGSFCSLYGEADDLEIRGTQMPASEAVLDLLR